MPVCDGLWTRYGPPLRIPMTMSFAGHADLLDPRCLEVLQVDESFGRRHGFWNGADFAHERQHAVEGTNVDLALARQNVFSDFQKRRKDLLGDCVGELSGIAYDADN